LLGAAAHQFLDRFEDRLLDRLADLHRLVVVATVILAAVDYPCFDPTALLPEG
jgi:hypothetical protein